MNDQKKEMIEIVDEQGNKTGIVMEKDIAHDKNLLHNEVGCFIINSKGQALLQKRSANKRHDPNKWAICAGHVDAGEALKTAMQREIEEEIGIKVKQPDIIPLPGYEKEIKNKEKNSHVSYKYYLKIDKKETNFIVQEEELSEVRWVNIDEVINMINSDDNPTVFGKDKIELFEKLKNL